jgi:hypothetical protein
MDTPLVEAAYLGPRATYMVVFIGISQLGKSSFLTQNSQDCPRSVVWDGAAKAKSGESALHGPRVPRERFRLTPHKRGGCPRLRNEF